jgi:hypothetical protein
MNENWNNKKVPLLPDQVRVIRVDYKRKKDSIYLSQLALKVDSFPKKDVVEFIRKWLDAFNKPGTRDIDSTWHQIMETYYNYDRYGCMLYCSLHQRVQNIYEEDRYKTSNAETPPNFRHLPYMAFLYRHYNITEVLPIVMQDNDLDREATIEEGNYVFKEYNYNQCKGDTSCIDNAYGFLKYYFKLNKAVKPKSYYLEVFESQTPKWDEYFKIQKEKREKAKNQKKN